MFSFLDMKQTERVWKNSWIFEERKWKVEKRGCSIGHVESKHHVFLETSKLIIFKTQKY